MTEFEKMKNVIFDEMYNAKTDEEFEVLRKVLKKAGVPNVEFDKYLAKQWKMEKK